MHGICDIEMYITKLIKIQRLGRSPSINQSLLYLFYSPLHFRDAQDSN